MSKTASTLSTIGSTCASLYFTSIGVFMVANAPSMLLCGMKQEIVSGFKVQNMALAGEKDWPACVWHNNLALYSNASSVVHFAQVHSIEIISYGLFFILSSLGAAIFLRSLGFLLSGK